MKRLVFMLVVLAVVGFCAELTGKWQLSMAGSGGRGQAATTLTLKQDGETLTGSLTSGEEETPIRDGKVSGDKVSFVVARAWGGRETKMVYTGRISGDEIRFKVSMPGAERTWDVPARRAP